MKRKKETKYITMHWQKVPLKNVPEAHRKLARKTIKGIKQHFSTRGHGWPLNWSFLVEGLANDILGYQLENLILNGLMDEGLVLRDYKHPKATNADFCIMKEKDTCHSKKAQARK